MRREAGGNSNKKLVQNVNPIALVQMFNRSKVQRKIAAVQNVQAVQSPGSAAFLKDKGKRMTDKIRVRGRDCDSCS
jgi:hypothetical protein